ncbi:cupin domain-containing protein [Treponema sp.]|uniref:cupin domain-containing protein n=1 Tax=Treponema sp. TaxID=166 RepID=UPI0038906C0D
MKKSLVIVCSAMLAASAGLWAAPKKAKKVDLPAPYYFDIASMEEKKIPNFKGGEGEVIAKMYADNLNRILYGRLTPGSTIGYHTHDTSSEIVYILEGTATIKLDDEKEEVLGPGQVHYCPKGHSHSTANLGKKDLVVFTVVTEQ